MIDANKIRDTINEALVEEYPEDIVYLDFCPYQFDRTGFAIEWIDSRETDANADLVEISEHFLITCFSPLSDYGEAESGALLSRVNAVKRIFRAGFIRVEDRALRCTLRVGGREEDCVFLDLTFQYFEERGTPAKVYVPMEKIEITIPIENDKEGEADMGLPNINIIFKTQAASFVKRSEKGVVAMILKDSKLNGSHEYTNVSEIPTTLTKENQSYIARAFTGYVNPPRKVLVYVLAADGELADALAYFATVKFDYLVGAPDCSEEDAQTIATWIKSRRADEATPKAVLPNIAADHEGIINFTTEGITAGETSYTAAQYCSRIAGLIAGTPRDISCTYAPLPELTDITRLSKDDMDTAIDAGKFILYHDGEKVKVARGVNSLVTTSADKGDAFKKIKIVETVDMIREDIQSLAEDSYFGKYANSYDNKCLLITAISGYLEQLELDGILRAGASKVKINVEAQEAYLKSIGVDTSKMSEQQIKEADTGAKVFLTASIGILDAIEDIDLIIFF